MLTYLAGLISAAALVATGAMFDGAGFNGFGWGSGGDKQNNLTLNWQRELQPSRCEPPIPRRSDDRHKGRAAPVINIVEKVKNDEDSGVAGNYWAYDNYTRRIQVWETATSTYCVIATYDGSFKAISGETAPAGTSTLTGAEKGRMQGGYRATLTGHPLATSSWPTKGSVGEVDYACDGEGSCPGYINWATQYFETGVSQNLDWWGWIYRGGKYGTWVNAESGNEGNISTPPKKKWSWWGSEEGED